LSSAWQNGAVAPITLEGLIGMLLASLPLDLCSQVSDIFQAHATATTDEPQARLYASLQRLAELKHQDLKSFPNTTVVGINVNAPERVIVKALEDQIKKWKQERNLSERRRRDDKLEEYLTVWDLREGWSGDHYDLGLERTLKQIALDQGIPLST